MAYEKIGWKDYPDKTTPMSAKNLEHMDEGIFTNACAIAAQNETFTQQLNQCFQSVSDGKAAVATALTNQGVATASDATFATMASNVTIAGSARYNSGYSAGVTAADNRANANSVNYQTGYNNGYNAGYGSGKQKINMQLSSYRGELGSSSSVIYVPSGYTQLSFSADEAVDIGLTHGSKELATASISGTVAVTSGNTYHVLVSTYNRVSNCFIELQ